MLRIAASKLLELLVRKTDMTDVISFEAQDMPGDLFDHV